MKKNKNLDNRTLEQNQNITKQYAVSYAMIVYHYLHPKEDCLIYAMKMIDAMRTIKPKIAVKKADKILFNKYYKESKNDD